MNYFTVKTLVILTLFLAGAARADQPRGWQNLADQVNAAGSIVHGKIISGQSRFEHGRIYTYYRLGVIENLKGAADGDIEVRVPGGVVGVVAYVVPGAPDFIVKQEGVLFLRSAGPGAWELDGVNGGVYTVGREQNGPGYVSTGSIQAGPVLAADGHLATMPASMPLADFKTLIGRITGRRGSPQADQYKPTVQAKQQKGKIKELPVGPRLAAGNVQAGFSRILQRPVDIFWNLERDYGPVSGGKVRWWFNPDSIDGKSTFGATSGDVLEAVRWSFEQWNEVADARIEYQYAGSRTDIADHKLDLVNMITFADSEYVHGIQRDAIASARPFALVRRTYVGPEGLDFDLDGKIDFPDFPQGVWEAGTIIDCDIRWDAGAPGADLDFATDGSPNALSVQGVFNHELGHFAGLVHSPIRDLARLLSSANVTPTMFSIAIPNPPAGGENIMHSLEFDDRLSLSMLYPAESFAAEYGAISGRVESGIDGKPVRGNFIAVLGAPTGEPYRSLSDAYNRASIATGVFTDQQGAFRIGGLPPGDYVLGLQPMDDDPPGTNKNAFNTLVQRFGDVDFVWDEFYNGADESAHEDDPWAAESVSVSAGSMVSGIIIISNYYPAGRKSLRRLFGERDFFIAANQLASPFSPVSSTQHLVARKLPQIFEPPYTVVSAVADFASNTAPPEGTQVVWPEIILALSDPGNPGRPWLENPLAVVRNFAGDGTLLSSDPLPFDYPVEVDGVGELWLVARSPEGKFNAYHNIDVLGAGQGELQVDESFISHDGGATFSSVMDFGISWRMGVVVQGQNERVPLAEPVLVQSDRTAGEGQIKLHFNRIRTLGGELVSQSPRISVRHTYNAPARQAGSVLRNVAADGDGQYSFTLISTTTSGDSSAWRITGFGLNERGDSLAGSVEQLSTGGESLGDWLMVARVSGFGSSALDGLYRGRFEKSATVFLDITQTRGLVAGAITWPATNQLVPDGSLLFSGEAGDTTVTLEIPQANPSGFELTVTDSTGRGSNSQVLGLGFDPNEPNQRLKDATPVFPAYGLPHILNTSSAIRGTIFATSDEDDMDWFSFPLHAGDSVEIDVDAVSSRPFDPPSSLDAYIELFDSTGARFTGADGREVVDDDTDGLDPYYTFVSPRGATAYLKLLDANVAYGDRGKRTGANAFYELRITIHPRRGDVVRDRVVRIDDVLAALEIAAGRARYDIQAITAADINRDNRVDNRDVGEIYRRAMTDPFGTGGGTLLADSHGWPPFEQFLRQLEQSGDADRVQLPKAFALRQNYPNPFNPSTTIAYSVPEGGGSEFRLEVFDIRGRLVRVLASGVHEPGSYRVQWEGTDESGREVPSGIYFSRMRAQGFSAVRKMVLVK
jgi:hypothetical protein